MQYDAVAWPSDGVLNSQRIPVPGLATQLWNYIWKGESTNSSSTTPKSSGVYYHPLEHNEATKLSLNMYLESFKIILCDCIFDGFRIESFSDEINHLFSSLQNQYICKSSVRTQVPIGTSLLQVIIIWFNNSVIPVPTPIANTHYIKYSITYYNSFNKVRKIMRFLAAHNVPTFPYITACMAAQES